MDAPDNLVRLPVRVRVVPSADLSLPTLMAEAESRCRAATAAMDDLTATLMLHAIERLKQLLPGPRRAV